MKSRKITLVLLAALALTLSMLGVASAATRGQDAPTDGDTTDAANAVTDVAQPQAYLGLQVTKLTDRIRKALGLPDDVDGLVVMGTIPGGPAAEAGLQRADVAMFFDGHQLVEPQQLRRFLNSKAPGDVIEVIYRRDGANDVVKIELGRKPDVKPAPRPEWLKQVHAFLRTFPNAVDGSLRLLDEDGEVRTFVLTPGEVVRISEDKIAVENKIGEVNVYEILDRTVFYARNNQIRLGVVEPGMQVAVLTVNGNLRAVVVTARADGDADGPAIDDIDVEPADDMAKIEARLKAEFEAYTSSLRERMAHAGVEIDADAVRARVAERAADLRARLAELRARVDAQTPDNEATNIRVRLSNAS